MGAYELLPPQQFLHTRSQLVVAEAHQRGTAGETDLNLTGPRRPRRQISASLPTGGTWSAMRSHSALPCSARTASSCARRLPHQMGGRGSADQGRASYARERVSRETPPVFLKHVTLRHRECCILSGGTRLNRPPARTHTELQSQRPAHACSVHAKAGAP